MDEETIVITGGAGFVGQHLLRELQGAWPAARLVVWDRQAGAVPAEYVHVDIVEPATYEAQLAAAQPAWLVHLAAVAQVPAALADPERVRRVNVTATAQLLAAAAATSPATRILAVSSADIYGRGSGEPVPELPLSAAAPVNPYGESKRDMEAMIAADYAERTVVARPFTHIGPGQGTGFVTADFASQIARIEAGQQAPVIKVGNLAARRDFTDVRDVVRAYRLLMERGRLGETYHVASGRAVSIQEILDRLLAFSAVAIAVEQDSARLRPADIPVLVGDVGKLQAATGWKPLIPLERSLQDVLAWWRVRVKALPAG